MQIHYSSASVEFTLHKIATCSSPTILTEPLKAPSNISEYLVWSGCIAFGCIIRRGTMFSCQLLSAVPNELVTVSN